MSSEQPEWEAIVVFVTAPAEEEAAAIARALVEDDTGLSSIRNDDPSYRGFHLSLTRDV